MPNIRYAVRDLGTLGGVESKAVALNNSAQIIGQSDTALQRDGRTVEEAFFWDKGHMTSLGEVTVKAINSQAWIIGRGKEKGEALIWHGPEKHPTPRELFGVSSVQDINDDNVIVGWIQAPNKVRWKKRRYHRHAAFILSLGADAGRMRLLESVNGSRITEAKKINNVGSAVGNIMQPPVGDSFTHRFVAALWDKGGLRKIATLPGFDESVAIDINDNGQVLCKVAYNQIDTLFDKEAAGANIVKFIEPADDSPLFRQRGFLYDNGSIEVFESRRDRNLDLNIPRAMNNHKQVVGTTGCGPTFREVPHALLFTGGEIYDLNDLIGTDQSWTLLDARDINGNGQIVGTGRRDGVRRGFLLDPT